METLKNLFGDMLSRGVSNECVKECFTKKLDRWQETVVNIAITGAAGAGKSRFINAIRG